MLFIKKNKKATFALTVLLLTGSILSSVPNSVNAQKLIDKYQSVYSHNQVDYTERENYSDVLNGWEEKGIKPAESDIELDIWKYSSFEGSKPMVLTERDSVALKWDKSTESISWKIYIPKSGLYTVALTYRTEGGTGLAVCRSLAVDGKIQYSESENIALQRSFHSEGENRINAGGDEIASPLEEFSDKKIVRLSDSNGLYTKPLEWYFPEGEHILTLGYVDQPAVIYGIELRAPEKLETYEQTKKSYPSGKYASEKIVFQAEDSKYLTEVSHSTLIPVSDGDPATIPTGITNVRLNTIGGTAWSTGCQSLTYEFSVPQDGVYQLALRAKQNWNNGISSYRQIKIDGEVPFSEMLAYEFPYSRQWYTEVLSDGKDNPYGFYLTEGRHTLTLSVVLNGQMSSVKTNISACSDDLSELYRDILLITGSEPDVNYDYKLQNSIPDMPERLQTISQLLKTSLKLAQASSGKNSLVSNNINMVLKTITEMTEKPDSIQNRLDDIVSSMTQFGTIISDLQNQPLMLDEIGFYPLDAAVEKRSSTVFSCLMATLRNFTASFGKDYNFLGDAPAAGGKTLEVWVSRGKEWANIMEEMISGDFATKNGIGVKLNVLPTGSFSGTINPLLLSITSGDTPDLILGVSPNIAVEYAIRDIVTDLSSFEDFETVKARFPKNSFASQTYGNGIYGLPETVNFSVLMYRRDIFNSLGLCVPTTWDEVFYQLLPVLYQNSMQMSAPSFETLLYQYGGKYYTDDGLRCNLNSASGYSAFEQYISMFLNLGFPITAEFYNRFRTGEMPAGIADYTAYMKILTAAPELAGKWDVALIPGSKNDVGEIDRTTVGLLSTSCIIMQNSDKKDDAWEFLKWWTSDDTQLEFGKRTEAKLGAAARWNTANVVALRSLPWDSNHIEIIEKALDNATDIPQVLGGSISTVAVNNAKNLALYSGYTPREAMETAVSTINKEFKRKQKNYLSVEKR